MKHSSVMLFCLLLAGCGAFYSQPEATAVAPDPYQALRLQAIERVVAIDSSTLQSRFVGKTEYVILSNFSFDPDLIELQAGTITRIRLSNSALVTHYFGGHELFGEGVELVDLFDSQIPPAQQHIPVAPFTERDLYLFAKRPGEYPLSCFVPNHVKAGMSGVVVVTAAAEPQSGS